MTSQSCHILTKTLINRTVKEISGYYLFDMIVVSLKRESADIKYVK